jgi:hypothetical protein
MLAADPFSQYYSDFLQGTYDCVDRVVLNGYFSMGCSPGGFRTWWRALYGTDDNLDNTHLMRLAGRFGRRLYGWAEKNKIPVIKCPGNERPHEVLEEQGPALPKRPGVFCVMVKRAPFPIWDVRRFGKGGIDLRKKKEPMPYVNHYAFHVLDEDWGHMIFKVCGHPPFTVQIIVNGHEFVANAARKQRLQFTKEDNCFTSFANAAGLQKVADTLRSPNAIGRLKQACAHWLSKLLCLALDVAEQKKSGFFYEFATYQAEYSRNLLFREGSVLEKVFQGVIDRTRAALDVKTVKTIFGRSRRGQHESRWEVVVERPSYDLTVFKIHCGKLTLKMYSKGERVLRIEAIVHNTRVLGVSRRLDKIPEMVERLQAMLERFLQVVRCVDVACLDDSWEELPTPSQVGTARVAGVDMNKARTRAVLQAVLALAVLPQRWGSAAVAAKVCAILDWSPEKYQTRHASYDLKKLRGKNLIRPDGRRYYEASAVGLQTIAALAILQDKVIKPVLAKATNAKARKKPAICDPIEEHYEAIQKEITALCQALGLKTAA